MQMFDGKSDMADITNASEGSWYQPIGVTTRVRPRVYSRGVLPAVSGLGVEETSTGKGVILLVGVGLLVGLYIMTRK